MEFGGGYFGYTNILSLDINGEWYIGNTLKDCSDIFKNEFIPFTDDQTGGFYCFALQNNVVKDEEIYYVHINGTILLTDYKNFFDYLIRKAYK